MPTTVPIVTRIEMVKATGKLVSSHAAAKPEKSIGDGREKALPSTACVVDFSDIETVTYSGSSTVSAQRSRMTMVHQLVRSWPIRRRRRRDVATVVVVAWCGARR